MVEYLAVIVREGAEERNRKVPNFARFGPLVRCLNPSCRPNAGMGRRFIHWANGRQFCNDDTCGKYYRDRVALSGKKKEIHYHQMPSGLDAVAETLDPEVDLDKKPPAPPQN